MSDATQHTRAARELLKSQDFSKRVDAVDALGRYGDAQDIDRLIAAQSDKGDANNRDVMFWRAGFALEQIAKRLGSSGTPQDVPGLLKLTRVDLTVEAAVQSLVTIFTRHAAEISTDDLVAIAQLDDRLSQRRSRPIRELDYEGNETVWEPVDCVVLKGLAQQELERRRT